VRATLTFMAAENGTRTGRSEPILTPGTAWPDLLAGLSLAGLILPEAVAYAGIAGLPPLSGLLAALAGLCCYALLGTSRFAIVAATSSSAAVLASALHSVPGLDGQELANVAGAIVMVSGLLFLICSALRLGALAQFIARPVVRGFALGLALVITVRQLGAILGIHAKTSALGPVILELAERHAEWQPASIVLGVGSLLLLAVLERWHRIPGALLVIVLASLAVPWASHLGGHVELVGRIQLAGFRLHWPALSVEQWSRIAELAVALLLILFAESYGSVRACALRHGDEVKVNRELFALGMANVAAGLLQGTPVGAGYSATTANEGLGARTRLSGFATACCIAAAIALLLRQIALIPEPVLAAIVIFALRHAVSIQPLRPYLLWKRDRFIVLVAIAAVLLLGVLDGLLAGIGVSLAMLIRDWATPRLTTLGRLGDGHDFVNIDLHRDARAVPGVLILRPEEPLFFGNVEAVLDGAAVRLKTSPDVRALVLSLEESPDLDGTAVEALGQFALQVEHIGRELRLARLKDPVVAVLNDARLPALRESALSGCSRG
jgi:MFS superfamily sulfate permease-like transporter